MIYRVHLYIDEGEREIEASSELEAKQKAICDLFFRRRKEGINKSFKPIAKIQDKQEQNQ